MDFRRFPFFALFLLGAFLIPSRPGVAGEPFTFPSAASGKAGIFASEDVLSDKASEAAVQVMSQSLRGIFDAEFRVGGLDSGKAVGGIFIRLVQPDEKLDGAGGLPARGPNAFLLKTEKERLHIVGNSQVAIQNAIYTVLDALGCRWYFPGEDWTYLPKLSSYDFSADRIESPNFKFCRLFPGIGRPGSLNLWSARNRLNRYDKGYIHHSLGLDPKLFTERPDLFALRDSGRTRKQICYGNAETRKLVAENAVAYLKNHSGMSVVSVEPPDNLAHCQDASTLALGDGSPSDAVFFLANEVAREVNKAVPGANVGLYAYLAHASPPSFDLEKNVYVEITTNLRKTDLSIPEAIQAFRGKGAQVGVRDYLSIPQWHHGRIGGGSKGSNFLDTPKEVANWARSGIVGYSAEMSDNWACNGLTYFLVSQVLWSPDCDVNRETGGFFRNMFGEAAPAVRGLFERWQKRSLTRVEIVADSIARLEEARLLDADPVVQKRLAQLGMAVYWNYLFWELQQEVAENPGAVATGEASPLRELVRWGARIEPTRMIDTYALSRVFTRISSLRKLDALSGQLGSPLQSFVNGLNGTWWLADARLGVPADAEVWERLGNAGAALSAAEVRQLIARDALPPRLVPVREGGGAAASLNPGAAGLVKWLPVPKGVPVVFWAAPKEKVLFPLAAQVEDLKSPFAVHYEVARYGEDGMKPLASGMCPLSLERGAWRKAATEGDLPVIEFQASEGGAYVLRLESEAKLLGVFQSEDLRKRPMALALNLGEQGLIYAERYVPAQEEVPEFFAYWPKAAEKALVIGNKGHGSMKIEIGNELLMNDERFGSEQIQRVTPGKSVNGGIAKITTEGVSFAFRGLPLFLSPSAGQVLMPAD